jgi:DnaK suppressor protein
MAAGLSEQQVKALREKLEGRLAELRETIRGELAASDEEHYIELAGRVHDVAEESLADLLADLTVASIDREIKEVRDVEAALQRIPMGSYGLCVDCGDAIGVERLSAQPAAARCLPCQDRYEKTHAGEGHPKL